MIVVVGVHQHTITSMVQYSTSTVAVNVSLWRNNARVNINFKYCHALSERNVRQRCEVSRAYHEELDKFVFLTEICITLCLSLARSLSHLIRYKS
jgi:hypothetical protein